MKEKIPLWLEQFSNSAPGELIAFFAREYGKEVAFSTSLGAEDQVITHMIASSGQPVRVFTLDTGRLFQETYDLIDITEKKYGIRMEVFFPDATAVETMVGEKGINLFYESIENRRLCCGVRKSDPLKRALSSAGIWITGMRKDQSVTRTDAELIEWDELNQVVKVNPLIHWSHEQVWDYIREHHVPYNTLHDQAYPSIGCQPCTRAIAPGEDIRAGRWWWEHAEHKECGLHK